MLALDVNVKSGMLISKVDGSTTITFGRHDAKAMASSSASSSLSDKTRLPIPEFSELNRSPQKKSSRIVRKMKTFVSASNPATPNLQDEFEFSVQSPISSSGIERTAGSDSTSSRGKHSSSSASVQGDAATRKAAAMQVKMLQCNTLATLHPENHLKKLRVMLRNERLAWIDEFVSLGGYEAMLDRLHEVMTVEWREEQHDDAVLLELLRCFRALLMSEVSPAPPPQTRFQRGVGLLSYEMYQPDACKLLTSLVVFAYPATFRRHSARSWSSSTLTRSREISLRACASWKWYTASLHFRYLLKYHPLTLGHLKWIRVEAQMSGRYLRGRGAENGAGSEPMVCPNRTNRIQYLPQVPNYRSSICASIRTISNRRLAKRPRHGNRPDSPRRSPSSLPLQILTTMML